MKILYINSVCGIGSTGKIVVDLAREAAKQGHKCFIAFGRGDAVGVADDECIGGRKSGSCRAGGQKTEGNSGKRKTGSGIGLYKIESKTGVLIHVVKSRLTDRQGFYSKTASRRFAAWIKKLKPDIIHLHNIHGYYLHMPTLFDTIKDMNVKVVWTLHDCWAFTGHCSHFDYKACNRWRKQCFDCPQKKEYPAGFFLEQSRRNYREKRDMFCGVSDMTIVTPSKWLAGLVEESFLGKAYSGVKINRDVERSGNNVHRADKENMGGYRIQVINNGIDLNVFHETKSEIKKKHGIADKRVILGVASQWSQKKGLRDFIRLSRMLDKRYQIVLIGLTKKQLRQLPSAIMGIERTSSGQELAMWYTAADVFVNPTYEDTYSMVNVEALSCGTPVVTYRTGGAAEMIEDFVNLSYNNEKLSESGKSAEGFVCESTVNAVLSSHTVEKGDLRGLYKALKETVRSSSNINKDGDVSAELKNVNKAFSKERMLLEYMKVYLG